MLWMPDPRGRPGPLTREAVIASARELIIAEGIDSVSLRGLGRRLGVTAPALYAYVEDREDLLRAVAHDALGQLGRRFAAIDADGPLDRIRQQCRCYVEFAVENPSLFITMFTFPPALPVATPIGIETDEATLVFARAGEAIEAAAAAGLIEVTDDPLLAALSMWATMHGLATVLTMGFGFDDGTREKLIERSINGVMAALGVVE